MKKIVLIGAVGKWIHIDKMQGKELHLSTDRGMLRISKQRIQNYINDYLWKKYKSK